MKHEDDDPSQAGPMMMTMMRREEGAPSRQCLAEGCVTDLETRYCQQRRLCSAHLRASALQRRNQPGWWRFCQQCGKLERLEAFDGDRRSCRVRLAKRRAVSFRVPAPPRSPQHNDGDFGGGDDGGASAASAATGGCGGKAPVVRRSSVGRAASHSALEALQYSEEPQPLLQDGSNAVLKQRLQQVTSQLAAVEQQLLMLNRRQQAAAELMALEHQCQQLHAEYACQLGALSAAGGGAAVAAALSAPVASLAPAASATNGLASAGQPWPSAEWGTTVHPGHMQGASTNPAAFQQPAGAAHMLTSLSAPLAPLLSAPAPAAAAAAGARAALQHAASTPLPPHGVTVAELHARWEGMLAELDDDDLQLDSLLQGMSVRGSDGAPPPATGPSAAAGADGASSGPALRQRQSPFAMLQPAASAPAGGLLEQVLQGFGLPTS